MLSQKSPINLPRSCSPTHPFPLLSPGVSPVLGQVIETARGMLSTLSSSFHILVSTLLFQIDTEAKAYMVK